MRHALKKLFWPILKHFETDQEPANYKQSHRVALVIVGVLFLCLATGSGLAAVLSNQLGALIPVVVFAALGVVTVVIGSLGSNGAVSKIWGTDK